MLNVADPLTLFGEEGSLLLYFLSLSPMYYLRRQPLQHPGGSHVSLWANSGAPPGFLNTTSGPAAERAATSPGRCRESPWCHQTEIIPPARTADWRAAHFVLSSSRPRPVELYFCLGAEPAQELNPVLSLSPYQVLRHFLRNMSRHCKKGGWSSELLRASRELRDVEMHGGKKNKNSMNVDGGLFWIPAWKRWVYDKETPVHSSH